MPIVALTSGSGNWTVPAGVTSISVLVVAGGGAGGLNLGGGGGAGGYVFNPTFSVIPEEVINYVIGSGGVSQSNGGDSTFKTITAIGGGRGGSNTLSNRSGLAGGSGGGGGSASSGGVGVGGLGTSGQGNNGGQGTTSGSFPCGGGGGASAVGANGSGSQAGNGGAGIYFGDIFGNEYGSLGWFCGGGGGAIYSGGTPGSGNSGGGSGSLGTSGGNALAGTGSGGGGAGFGVYSGGAGGSGIILIKYQDSQNEVFSQEIKITLSLKQPLNQKLFQREIIGQSVKLALKLNQFLIKGFSLTTNVNLKIKLTQDLYKSIAGYGKAVTLFNEPLPIEQISLTFDQLGRPLVFYRVGEDTLKLYWYDPVAQQNVLTNFGIGKDPTACFDFPQDTGQSFSDALLFYVRDDQVFMRIQRDRYAIEYPCPASNDRLSILSSGLRVDNRLQVVYKFKSVPEEYFKNFVIESDFTINLLNDVNLSSVIGNSLNVTSNNNLSILTQVNIDSIPNYYQESIKDIVTDFNLGVKNDLNILSFIFEDFLEPTVVTTFSLSIKNDLNILSLIFEEPLTPTDVISEISIESRVNFSFNSEKTFEKNDTGYLFGTSNLGSFITYYDDNLDSYTQLAEPNINTFGILDGVKLPSCVSADECWFAQVKPNELNKIEFYTRYGSSFNLSNTLTLSLIENGKIISIALSSNGNYLAVGFSYSFLLTDTENKSSDLYYLVKVFRKINGEFQEIPFNNQLTLKGGFVTEEYKDAEIDKGDFPIEELEEQWATFRYNVGVVQLSFNPVDNDLVIIYENIIKSDQALYINWFNKNGDLFEESLWPIAQTPATPNKVYWQNNNDLVVSHAFSPFHTKYSKLLGSFRVSATTPFPPAKNVVGNAAFTLGWAEGAFKNDIAVLSGGTNPLNRVIYENNSIWFAGGGINPVIDISNLVLSPKGNKLLCSALFYNESNNTTGLFKIFNKNNYDYVLSDVDLGEYKIDGFGYAYTPNFCYWFTENNQLSLDDTKKVDDSFYLKTYSLVDFSDKKLGVTNSYITEDVRGFNWVWLDINRIRSDDRGIFLGDIDNYKVTVEFIYTVNSLNRATIKVFEVIENGIGFSIDILSNGAISVTNLMDNFILTSEYRYTTLGETVHLAVTSSNGITTLWLNGVNQGSVNWLLPMFSQSIRLNQGWFTLNQLRITKEVRYTSNFSKINNFNMDKEFINE